MGFASVGLVTEHQCHRIVAFHQLGALNCGISCLPSDINCELVACQSNIRFNVHLLGYSLLGGNVEVVRVGKGQVERHLCLQII